jgi:putative nucleotidyltransferase with HDIG domain
MALGENQSELIVIMGTATATILCLGSIRTRRKLIYVGLFSGAVAIVLNLLMETIDDQPLDWILLGQSLFTGLWTLLAGFIIFGMLPFIEHAFGVLTDLSLLELGDVSHPLLQELIRRAPSTYNHSVTVGSIAEAAAESIGARGLLCRVGAYFHDIGKMLKPAYFIENQSTEGNRHESLMPAMSTLVIIAHIKDGSDLGRQHHLPQPIVDLIVQHHGTMLVEYFYGLARKESDPEDGEIDESSFRYPGPKPQTKEAAVLMLADAVESASRTLVDPTPARIEGIVRELAERRLDDGQFDESGLTLRELRTIERSLAMSLASIYHGRIKYPDQKTA